MTGPASNAPEPSPAGADDEHPPKTAADWSARYRDQDTPWDCGGPYPELVRRIETGSLRPPHDGAHALVPGAGYGHDALALARAGWRVTAIDFAAGTRDAAANELESRGGRFLAVDALAFGRDATGGDDAECARYDLVFDHTFFCAIHPTERGRWGEMVARCLAATGRLASVVFPGGKSLDAGGPPWGTELDHQLAALGPDFETLVFEPCERTLERRDWKESWAEFGRVR